MMRRIIVGLFALLAVSAMACAEPQPSRRAEPAAVAVPSPIPATPPTSKPEPTAAPAPTRSPEPTATATPTPEPTATPTPTPEPTSTPTPTAEPTATPKPTATPTPIPLAETYTNESFGFSINYPSGWAVNEARDAVSITHPAGSNMLIGAEAAQGLSLEEYAALSYASLIQGEASTPGVWSESGTEWTKDPHGYLVSGTQQIGGTAVNVKAWFTVNEGYGIFAAVAVLPALSALHSPILDQMLGSIRFFSPKETSAEAFADDHGGDPLRATPVRVGVATPGTIEGILDSDWFSFQAERDHDYQIDIELGSLNDSLLSLIDIDGVTLLRQNDDYGKTLASRIEWNALQSGTYYIVVENAAGVSTGTYTLTATRVGGDGGAPSTPAPAATTPQPLTELYNNDAYGYSVGYPSGWALDDQVTEVSIQHKLGTTLVVQHH